MSEKIQKVLAAAGFGSRRELERMIAAGRIRVNGQVAEIGLRVSGAEKIYIDNRHCKLPKKQQETRVLIYHKPAGEICTHSDPQGRPMVFDALPHIKQGRWLSIGRLDINTSGLLLFTNDGVLANSLMHPAQEYEREYAVRIFGRVDRNMVQRLTCGVQLEDGSARFEHVVDSGGEGANHWFHVVVMEGRNRLVRRLWESQNVTVSRLVRVRYGPIILEKKLHTGQWVECDEKQLKALSTETS